jgi:hypothetical protein
VRWCLDLLPIPTLPDGFLSGSITGDTRERWQGWRREKGLGLNVFPSCWLPVALVYPLVSKSPETQPCTRGPCWSQPNQLSQLVKDSPFFSDPDPSLKVWIIPISPLGMVAASRNCISVMTLVFCYLIHNFLHNEILHIKFSLGIWQGFCFFTGHCIFKTLQFLCHNVPPVQQ